MMSKTYHIGLKYFPIGWNRSTPHLHDPQAAPSWLQSSNYSCCFQQPMYSLTMLLRETENKYIYTDALGESSRTISVLFLMALVLDSEVSIGEQDALSA